MKNNVLTARRGYRTVFTTSSLIPYFQDTDIVNRPSSMRLRWQRFCIMNYQSPFPVRFLEQLLLFIFQPYLHLPYKNSPCNTIQQGFCTPLTSHYKTSQLYCNRLQPKSSTSTYDRYSFNTAIHFALRIYINSLSSSYKEQ